MINYKDINLYEIIKQYKLIAKYNLNIRSNIYFQFNLTDMLEKYIEMYKLTTQYNSSKNTELNLKLIEFLNEYIKKFKFNL